MVVTPRSRIERALQRLGALRGLRPPVGPRLFRYVHREVLLPTTVALVGFTAALLTKDLLGFADLVINHGLGPGAVTRIAFFEAVPLAAQTLPFAVLVGTLTGLGRLAADRELIAIASVGVPERVLALPAATFAAMLGLAGLALGAWGTPWATRSLDAALTDLVRSAPGASIRPSSVTRFGDHRLEVREVSSDGSHLRGVLLWVPGLEDTLFARTGTLESTDAGELRLRLEECVMLLAGEGSPRWLRFEGVAAVLSEPALSRLPEHEDPLRRLGLSGLRSLARAPEGDPDLSRRAALELHRRIALPAGAPLLALIAVPLALLPRRLSRSGGAIIGILVTVVYYGLTQLGVGLVQGGTLGPVLGAWLPDAVLLAAATGLLQRADGRPHALSPPAALADWTQRMRRWPRELPRPLDWYVAIRYLEMSLLAFAALVVAYFVVDLLERLDWFARYQATLPEALHFYTARIWLLASRVLPMGLLAGCALAVGRLTADGELVAMRACGISALRGLSPLLIVAGVAMPFFHVLNDVVVPRTNALADRIKDSRIKDLGPTRAVRTDLWYRFEDAVFRIERLDAASGRAQGLTLYELGPDGLPVARSDAASARFVGAGLWELEEARRVEVDGDRTRVVAAHSPVELGEESSTWVDPMHLSASALLAFIRETERDGFDARRFRVDLHVRLASPLACLVLPAVVLFFAVGGPPAPRPSHTLLVSVALGVGYVLLTGVAAALGYGGVVSPAVAGWGLPLAIASVCVALAFRNRS